MHLHNRPPLYRKWANRVKTVGIVGGLGPLAGAHFYRRLIELSPATDDSTHLPMILVSNPWIPSRIEHLEGRGRSPVPELTKVCKQLISVGAELIVIPSSTTHAYYDELQRAMDVHMVSLVQSVADDLRTHSIKKVGILATTPTRQYRIYEEHFKQYGIDFSYPDSDSQEQVMEVIQRTKAGMAGELDGEWLNAIVNGKWSDGSDGVLLACTELPVVYTLLNKERGDIAQGKKVLDATDILAKRVIEEAYESRHNEVSSV